MYLKQEINLCMWGPVGNFLFLLGGKVFKFVKIVTVRAPCRRLCILAAGCDSGISPGPDLHTAARGDSSKSRRGIFQPKSLSENLSLYSSTRVGNLGCFAKQVANLVTF